MRFRLKRILLGIILVALIPFIMHMLETLRFKPRKHRLPKIELSLPPLPNIGTCDNSKCNPTVDGMLNVHIVAHSHDDVGWKKTMQQYYDGHGGGNKESFYHGGECTRCILNNAIRELMKNTTRRFIFVEMAFFSAWYNEQSPDMKDRVIDLINKRSLEFTIGGWSMSDSATTYYDDVIDQHTLGFQFIQKEFGECAMPKAGWHVDQFGHSREHSSLFAQMGFDGLFLGRIDFQDQNHRTKTGNMDSIWRTSPENLGDKTSLFTSVLYDGYFSPERFRWEGWGPGMLSERNQMNYVEEFIKIAEERAKAYKSNHVLIPFGGDFAFNTAAGWFDGIDNLIKYVNAKQKTGSKVNVLYSTPACYIYHVNKEKVKYQTLSTDFFPYSTIPNTFWTGFFTSRPGLKEHIKRASSLLQTCKQLAVLANLDGVTPAIAKLKQAVAILQHHDAITGTEMQHVTDDYNKMLSVGETACQEVVNEAYKQFLPLNKPIPRHEFCPLLNITVCSVTENSKAFTMTIFNPLGHIVTHYARLPVTPGEYTAKTADGVTFPTQVMPLPSSTKTIPERRPSRATAELVFKASIPPLGFINVDIKRSADKPEVTLETPSPNEDIVLQNKLISLTIDRATGITKTLRNLETDTTIKFEQSYMYYFSSEGQKRDPNDRTGGFLGSHKRASGAYAFVPKEDTEPVKLKGPSAHGVKVTIAKGENVQEVHQEFSNWVSQVIRLYDDTPYIELEWTVGPISEDDHQTREVISNFQTDMATSNVIYMDSNGREMIKRELDKRETWKLEVTSPISGNYYPVTGRMYMQDEGSRARLTVLTDRCQGGASLRDGQMELMVHRRTFKDDDLGVEEPLNERGVDGRGLIIRGKHYVFLDTIERSAAHYRYFGLTVHHPPTVSFMTSPTGEKIEVIPSWSGLRGLLPMNVHVLTLDQLPEDPDTLLLRLENYYELNELTGVSQTATVELQTLFSDFDISSVREMSLGANHNITHVSRLQWHTEDGALTPAGIGSPEARYIHEPPFEINLEPMEIRTFHVKTVKRDPEMDT